MPKSKCCDAEVIDVEMNNDGQCAQVCFKCSKPCEVKEKQDSGIMIKCPQCKRDISMARNDYIGGKGYDGYLYYCSHCGKIYHKVPELALPKPSPKQDSVDEILEGIILNRCHYSHIMNNPKLSKEEYEELVEKEKREYKRNKSLLKSAVWERLEKLEKPDFSIYAGDMADEDERYVKWQDIQKAMNEIFG